MAAGLPNYYVFFRDRDDKWSAGINLGPGINMPGAGAISPAISPDLRFFFFAAGRLQLPPGTAAGPLSLSRLLELHSRPQNGSSDIYWVDLTAILQLRPKQ